MSPEQQRIAIAEFCGWVGVRRFQKDSFSFTVVGLSPKDPFPHDRGEIEVPDYLNDLNAINQAERLLDNESGLNLIETLCAVRGGWEHNTRFDLFVKSTAAQRAEALLRTIGKWTDQKSPPNPHSTK